MEKKLKELLEKYSHTSRDSLIPILQDVHDELGYLSEESLSAIGKHLNVPTSKIYGLATFYNQFRFQPKGKNHIRVCHGSSCHLMGTVTLLEVIEKILKIKPGQTSRDGKFSLEVVSCVGACAQSPVISINGKPYGKLTTERLEQIIEEQSSIEPA
ncbi:MAG: NADH-quinone oxidoreductase subunit NuoE [Tenuifilaceae bacterium]|jgi:NADH-quinone oxidoreductase subunit E|uniref:NADH-quinone oxidoreductase subunit NuoE n=1 Tax=Perlabentimonas gracilis TaxID=2715279 RepID=UPI001407AD86|nr:NADH-quinone oxidoreductase subunit NuoE [Perlabentimonas gracilis]MDX9770140.1 NADH-quinone oxidoreductase subunit NuoE [Tenuifilaceae bacterium]NHB67452.1 NADH-quinone oxidoreductase subunit NuoE [Perlabentimonas gracilis]